MQYIVTGELALLFQDLVLVNKQVTSERLVLILLDQFLHTSVVQNEELAIGLHSEVHIHIVLHEEGTMVDCGALVELLKHELVILKLSVGLNDALFDEIERVGWGLLSQHNLVLLLRHGLEAEHQVKEHLIIMFR